MKRVLSFILTVCLLATLTPFSFAVSAEDDLYDQVEGIYSYNVYDGEAHITDVLEELTGSLTIPDTLGGYPVTGIDSSTFQSCRQMTGIIIPEGITYIGDNAFAFCTSLERINFPASAEYIGAGVLMGCTSLESITVAEGNPVYHSEGNCLIEGEYKTLIAGCKNSVIPADGSVEKLASQSFRYIEGLTSIVIPDSVTEISSYVFNSCSSLESITLSKNLTILGNGAFGNCTKLKSVTIPDGVKRIGYEAFAECTALESVTLCAGTQRIEPRAFYQCYYLSSINIPETVNYIGRNAFSNCRSLDEVIFERTEDWSADDTELLSADLENAETAADYLTSIYSSCEWIIKDESNAFIFDIDEGEAFITGVQSWVEGDVTIPAEIDGYPVTHIAWNAFGGNESITSITIPDSVEYIEDFAFNECTALESIDLGDGVKYIGSNAFSSCPLLQSVHIPASTEQISWGLFGGCTNLESITVDEANPVYHSAGNCLINTETRTLVAGCDKSVIPADGSVEIIGRGAFEYCKNLESVTIPASVTIIDEYAFDGCEALESVTLTEGLEEIGYGAFYDCASLESIDIPASVTYIGNEVFYGCYNLSEITVDEDNTVYHSAGNCLIDTETNTLIVGCYTSVIPDDGSVETIGTHAFSGSFFLESIEIPEGVTMIDYSAFSNCISLESVSLPRSLKYIESDAFAYCQYLESITIPAGVEYIGRDAFYGCESLTAVYFESPENWRIEYEDTVIEGLDDAETAADYLTSEDNYYGIEKIILYRYEVEDGGAIIFQADKSLSGDIVVPDTLGGYPVTGIYYGAFEGNEEITSIELPDSITYIGEDAFWGCSALESIKLPANLEYIDANAFYRCEALESIHIPAGVEFIGEYAFSGCAALESITVDEDNTVYHSKNNCLIDTEAKLLVMGCNTSVIPTDGSIEIIGDGAFAGCKEIESITIPESVTDIGYGAFMECMSLTSLHIPSSVTYIGEALTVYCTNLESITVDEDNIAYHSAGNCLVETETGTIIAGCNTSIIPADGSITAIGMGAFAGCEALTDIELPEGVEFIGYGAFSECPNLESISLPESLTIIDEYAFAWCESLVSIEIPEGITEIGSDTFYYCSALESVKLPESLVTIGSYAFSDCTSLTSIRIPANVTRIGYRAFDWCENLTEVIFENPEGWFFMGEDVSEYLADPEIAVEALTNLYDDLVKYEAGDVDGEDGVTASDAIYLLYHVFFGEGRYPVNQACDFDGNEEVEAADAIYLLYHVFFGENRYPLN